MKAFVLHDVGARIDELSEILVDCVAGGASVSFMAGFSRGDARAYWRRIAADPERIVFATEPWGGTAQLVLSSPPNQPHRAELAKMLVHRGMRGRGAARALFQAVEREALARGRTLLTFDTVSGSPAERLYLSCGCVKVGEIPGYALLPDGTPCPTSVMYKRLA